MKPQGSPHLGQGPCCLSQAEEPTVPPAGPWLDCVRVAGATPPRMASGSSLGINRGIVRVLGQGERPWSGGDFPTHLVHGLLDANTKTLPAQLLPPIQPHHPPSHHPQSSQLTLQPLPSPPRPLPSLWPLTLQDSLSTPPQSLLYQAISPQSLLHAFRDRKSVV